MNLKFWANKREENLVLFTPNLTFLIFSKYRIGILSKYLFKMYRSFC